MATKKATSVTPKTETVKETATKAETVKVSAKAETAKTPATEAATEDKAPEKKAPAKKATTTKKTTTKAATAKKPAAKKTAAKKEMKVSAVVQYGGKEVEEKDIIARVKKAWTASGKKVGDIKTMDLYIKPEETTVYYVINGTDTGSVEF